MTITRSRTIIRSSLETGIALTLSLLLQLHSAELRFVGARVDQPKKKTGAAPPSGAAPPQQGRKREAAMRLAALAAALWLAAAPLLASASSAAIGVSQGPEGGEDEDPNGLQSMFNGDVIGAAACALGAVASLLCLARERYQWELASYNRFSVATKVPVQVLCVSGPLVLVSSCLYALLGALLLMGGTREVFYICASWAAICIDMSSVLYDSVNQVFTNWIDVVIHLVNLFVIARTFRQLQSVPVVFMTSGTVFWTVVLGMRLWRKITEEREPVPPKRHGNVSP